MNGVHEDLKVDGDNVIIFDVNTKTGAQLNGLLLVSGRRVGSDRTRPVPQR